MTMTSEEDDTVFYSIYLLNAAKDSFSNALKYCYQCLAIAHEISAGFIWEVEEFNLHVSALPEEQGHYITGSIKYGDYIDDEWFVVYILLELSKRFSNELACTVSDADGQILLIESAEFLPKWVSVATPELMQNRVFIKGGVVHILPLPDTPALIATLPPVLTIEHALNVLNLHPEISTVAPPPVQESVAKRMVPFLHPPRQQQHNATLLLPLHIAIALKVNPQLIAPAINAFVARDPTDLKNCAGMKRFNPSTGQVFSRLTFTHCLFAQLNQQRDFVIPKAFLPLPSPSDPTFTSAVLGAKLASGFEIAYHNSASFIRQEQANLALAHDYPFNEDPRWKNSVENLCIQTCECEIKEVFLEAVKKLKRVSASSAFAYTVDTVPTSNISFPPFTELPKDDSVEWLEAEPDLLFMQLEKEAALWQIEGTSNSVADQMDHFLSSQSDYRGITTEKTGKLSMDPSKFLSLLSGTQDLSNSEEEEEEEANEEDFDLDEEEEAQLEQEMQSIARELQSAEEPTNNFLQSFSKQRGEPGPLTNILAALPNNPKQH